MCERESFLARGRSGASGICIPKQSLGLRWKAVFEAELTEPGGTGEGFGSPVVAVRLSSNFGPLRPQSLAAPNECQCHPAAKPPDPATLSTNHRRPLRHNVLITERSATLARGIGFQPVMPQLTAWHAEKESFEEGHDHAASQAG